MNADDRRIAWTLVVNAEAGSSDDTTATQVADVLGAAGDVTIARTRGRDDLGAVVDATPVDGVIVALGGDGSIHAVVAAVDRLERRGDVIVALVPMGTGNDFARTIGADVEDPVAAARGLLDAEERRADLIRTGEGVAVVNAAHVGVGAEATREASRWKKVFGPFGYAVGALVSGVRSEGFRGEVSVDGTMVETHGRLLQVAVGNGKYVGGGAPLLPHADPFDGVLDVAVSWADAPMRRLGYAWRLRRGDHLEREDALALRGQTVTVTSERVRGNVDGETTEPTSSHTWTVEPAAWRLLVPPATATAATTE